MDVSVLIRPPTVDGLSVLDRLYIGHMSANLTLIQDRFKTEPIEIKPTGVRHISNPNRM